MILYWRGVKLALQESLFASFVFKDGFWPKSHVQTTRTNELAEDGEEREEFEEDDAFVGHLRARPQPSFRVGRDLFKGYFVAIRTVDDVPRPMRIGRALSGPYCNPENPNRVLTQYSRPTSRNRDVQDFYTGWDSERDLRWNVDLANHLFGKKQMLS